MYGIEYMYLLHTLCHEIVSFRQVCGQVTITSPRNPRSLVPTKAADIRSCTFTGNKGKRPAFHLFEIEEVCHQLTCKVNCLFVPV